MKLKTLIVDDEHAARKEIRFHLQKCDALEIVGEASNTEEAHTLVTSLKYDLLVLDINLPGGTVFSLIEKISHMPDKPYIVFVTGHEHFAADAFGVDAVDYVMKPIDPMRIKKAIQKVLNLAALEKKEIKEKPTRNVGLIPVELKEKTLLIPEQDIVFFYADDDYTFLNTQKNRYLIRQTLKELEQRLNPELFTRCHRSYLVNLKKIHIVSQQPNGTLILTVSDDKQSKVPVSRAQAKRVRQLLGI